MKDKERGDVRDRGLDAPLHTFSVQRALEQLRTEAAWKVGDRNAMTLVKTDKVRVVLIGLKKWASLLEHRVEGPMTLYVLEGAIKFVVGSHYCTLSHSGFVCLEHAIPHDVEALEESAFLLTIVQP
jgi:quercetin dioxygenase-like cupin family protein